MKNIKKTYTDAVYFASSPSNRKEQYYLNPSEFKVLIKLLTYDRKNSSITYSNKTISQHTYLAETTIKDVIESLSRKGFINNQVKRFSVNSDWHTDRVLTILWSKIEYIDNILPVFEKEAPKETISTQPIEDVGEEEKVSKIEAEIPKKEYISITSTDEFHNITNNKYTYANSKILNTKINNLLLMYKSGEIETFDDLINEVELLKEAQLETTN